MEDLVSKLNNILSSKEGQEQLKKISQMFNNNQSEQNSSNNSSSNQNSGLDFSALSSLLNGSNNNCAETSSAPVQQNQSLDFSNLLNSLNSQNQPQSPMTSLPNVDLNMIVKIQQLLSNMNANDKNSQLLLALKPHFGQRRQAKVDQAISLMRLFAVLPMIKESGLFSGL